MEGHCAPAAATVTDNHDLQLQILRFPSPAPINTDFIKFDGTNSPTWLHEILSDNGAYATLDPLVTSPQYGCLLSGDDSARRYQCAMAGAATVIQLPPFPSESWDSIGGFDVGTETATDGRDFSPLQTDFFDFDNPPEISQLDDPQYTGLLSDVVNFDSALDFPDRPEEGPRPEPKLNGPNSPTWLHEILSDNGAYATLDPLVTSPQYGCLLSGDDSARRYQCAMAGAATVIQLPPFPSESWDSIGGFDVGTETATGGRDFSPLQTDFFDFDNPPEISQLDDPQYTGLLSDVVNFDSALDFPGRPEEGPRPEPNLAEGKRKKKLRFWTKKEHMLFVIGIEMYGKGNWKDIATKLVVTKTSTQVASHAQKYYDYHQNPNSNSRQRNGKNGRSKSSIFEITTIDPHSKACLLHRHAHMVQPPSPPLPPPPPQQFTITNYYPPPHQPN